MCIISRPATEGLGCDAESCPEGRTRGVARCRCRRRGHDGTCSIVQRQYGALCGDASRCALVPAGSLDARDGYDIFFDVRGCGRALISAGRLDSREGHASFFGVHGRGRLNASHRMKRSENERTEHEEGVNSARLDIMVMTRLSTATNSMLPHLSPTNEGALKHSASTVPISSSPSHPKKPNCGVGTIGSASSRHSPSSNELKCSAHVSHSGSQTKDKHYTSTLGSTFASGPA